VQVLEISNAVANKAPPERFQEIYQQTEEKLSNLLTATQRAVLTQGLERKTIRIVANMQPWREALQYIADQGGYQLIMDAPPPGTLNYTDPEERTIIEALDLVNGLLISKGYTVVRKDRILQVLDLSGPIPNWAFPTESPEGQAGRASNEYVSVTHSF